MELGTQHSCLLLYIKQFLIALRTHAQEIYLNPTSIKLEQIIFDSISVDHALQSWPSWQLGGNSWGAETSKFCMFGLADTVPSRKVWYSQ